jgi:cell wall-associated NlpC family hydrolase
LVGGRPGSVQSDTLGSTTVADDKNRWFNGCGLAFKSIRPYFEARMLVRLPCFIVALVSFASLVCADEVVEPTARDFDRGNVLRRLARRMEPDLAGKPERVRQYVDFFQSEVGNDKRLFAFRVEPELVDGRKVRLRGYIEFPESKRGLVEFLKVLGFDVDDNIEDLPSADLGDNEYGLVAVSHSYVYDKPGDRRTVESDCLIGEPLYLLREDSEHFLVHSGEGYLGYIRGDDVRRVDAAAFDKYMNGPRVRLRADHQIAGGSLLPAGARLKLAAEHDDKIAVELPTGEQVSLPTDACDVQREPVVAVDALIAHAKQLLGTKYKWGGRTSQGVDCSGLVQLSYAAVGVQLPRDSYQQVYVGRLAATRWHRSGLRPGDTLYFLGQEGKIRHTGLYLGGDKFIQAVVPVVRINSLNPNDEDFDAYHGRSLAFAKRPAE